MKIETKKCLITSLSHKCKKYTGCLIKKVTKQNPAGKIQTKICLAKNDVMQGTINCACLLAGLGEIDRKFEEI